MFQSIQLITLASILTIIQTLSNQLSFKNLLAQSRALQVDPDEGWTEIKYEYEIQKDWNVSLNKRYSYDGDSDTHYFIVYKKDNPHNIKSTTKPRTEMAIRHYWTTNGSHQFEGEVYVPLGTSGVSLLQIFGGNMSATKPQATSFMLQIDNGNLTSQSNKVLQQDSYDRWIKVNIIHHASTRKILLFLDGINVYKTTDSGQDQHLFMCGANTQKNASNLMIVKWRNIKIFTK
ncbi:UNKNOWN [Stylonychia lemnae]|uniref:Alginate lyase 2 domain-containing protein n=1 Tax=Stylonychia lemnae TaxID=5949 RepID=A0A078AMV2_STYLE|nr:UNKNOWN [Stylonychia lemnae]|eukprot:CDW83251.1 UNKNOWN [Stylonychia lemnae]